jgi:hypothetical protein
VEEVYSRNDRHGNVWRVYHDTSFLANGHWVVYKNDDRWVGCSSKDEAKQEIREQCDD